MSEVVSRQILVKADTRLPLSKLAHHCGRDEYDMIDLLRGPIYNLGNVPKLKSCLSGYKNVAVYPRPEYRLQAPLQLSRGQRGFAIKLYYTWAQHLHNNPPNILFVWPTAAHFCDPNRQANCGVRTIGHNKGEYSEDRCERYCQRFHPHRHWGA